MNCPVCNKKLKLVKLIDDLVSAICSNCDGKWINQSHFYRWKNNLTISKLGKNNSYTESKGIKEVETKKKIKNFKIIGKDEFDLSRAKICPECEHILIKYRVSNYFDFHIETCGTCSGIWLDTNKWEIVYENNLHIELYNIFTDYWQKNIRDNQKSIYFDNLYNNRFGYTDFEKITNFKNWIDNKKNKREIIDFLIKT
ncbi:MAG: zf-TFIIB domain-containing protein [Clostridiales bacterium]